jgi:hypothetical protein
VKGVVRKQKAHCGQGLEMGLCERGVGSVRKRPKRATGEIHCHVAPETASPADRTQLVFLVARTNPSQLLLLPSGMHTKKLERYRED